MDTYIGQSFKFTEVYSLAYSDKAPWCLNIKTVLGQKSGEIII